MKLSVSLLLGALAAPVVQAQTNGAPNIVQTYFVPLPEADLFDTFEAIRSDRVEQPIQTTISIAIASSGTVIYYDHWEDGFDEPANGPGEFSTTLVWGDNDPENGMPPGFTVDTLEGGDVITLRNVNGAGVPQGIPIPRIQEDIFFDGSDRISANLPIAVTRSAFPERPGSLMAGAVEAFNRDDWGRSFIAPVSSDNEGETDPFEYAVFYIMAGFDRTEIFLNANATDPAIAVLEAGQNIVIDLNQGDVITSTRGIQVDLVAGDIGSQFELRWYAQTESRDWASEYFSPVGETVGNTGFWFYNPNETPIEVKFEGNNVLNNGQSVTVPAGGAGFINCQTGAGIPPFIQIDDTSSNADCENGACYTGLRFYTEPGAGGVAPNFYGFAQIDANGAGTLFDWGFPLLPGEMLTSAALVGRGDGCTTPTCGNTAQERSVVFVTPVEDAFIFVDYDGDGTFDENFPMSALASRRLTDTVNNDFDMTGAIIAASANRTSSSADANPAGKPIRIALAWGQDPQRSFSGDANGLDLGTAVLPLANPFVSKQVLRVVNPDGTDDPFSVVDQTGDIIVYEITVSNVGFTELRDVRVDDPLIGDALVGPFESANTDGILARGETFTYNGNYTVTSNDIMTKGGGDDNIENTATVTTDSPFPPVTVSTETPIFLSAIQGNVTEDLDNDDLGDVPLVGVVITLIDSSGAVVGTTLTDATGTYTFEDVEAGQYTVVQTNLDASYSDVSDADGAPDLNTIAVTLTGGDLTNANNNFVDERLGSILGTVNDDNGNPIPDVVLQLMFNGTVVMTTITTASGTYSFEDVGPQNYTIVEPDLPNYPTDLSDQDNSPDNDEGDTDTTVDNMIDVTLNPAEIDGGNDFVDSDNGSITGNVTDDLGNPLVGVNITLTSPDGSTVTITTGVDGSYSFDNLEPGAYTLTEVNPPGFPGDISDKDATPDGPEDTDTATDNTIAVVIGPGEVDDGNNFVDELQRGSISGMVSEDTDNDDVGDEPIPGVTITLLAADGVTIVATTLTDTNGNYEFTKIDDGTFFVVQTNLDGTYVDVSDSNGGPDLNSIPVTLTGGNGSPGNNFVDERPGTIVGTVKDDDEEAIPGVVITLIDTNSAVFATTETDAVGEYTFPDVPPGNYTLSEQVLPNFPTDVTDEDETDDGDTSDTDTAVDNNIGVTLEPAEVDDGNNFVDSAKGTIGGNVTDNTGLPIPGVVITLLDTSGTVVATTETGTDGSFTFEQVPPGDYILTEENSPLFPDDIRDSDLSPDGDVGETDTDGPDNQIGVTVTPGENDVDNSFVDTIFGSLTGTVFEDIDNNNSGDVPISGVTITLFAADGTTVIATTLTGSDGSYIFERIEDGDYFIQQTNLSPSFVDVSDKDGGDLNRIAITTTGGTGSTGNNFVDEQPGTITGTVTDDEDNPIFDAVLVLKDSTGGTEATTRTDSNGQYTFEGVAPGDYTVEQTINPDFPTSVSDQDDTNDGDSTDNDTEVDDKIGVTITPAEVDDGNNFVDSNRGRIGGFVEDDGGTPIEDVPIALLAEDGTTVLATTLTDSNGEYSFEGLSPGNYTLMQTNLPQYPGDVRDGDSTPDGDEFDGDTTPDNLIKVTLNIAENDDGNNFVDIIESASPSSAPSLPPSLFCKEVVVSENCTLCAPFRSTDYCNATESFPALLQSRTSQFRNNGTAVVESGYWFHYLEDKIAAYVLSAVENVPAPEVFCCVTTVGELAACLTSAVTSTGIVIKATNFHSNQGIYVLTNYTNAAVNNPLQPWMFDVINDGSIAYGDIMASMSFMGATKIIVEEFIGTTLPTEYKFHVVNGEIAAVDIIADRADDCPCYAVIDTTGFRLDKYGCFEPGGYGMTDADGCTVIDFTTGKRKAGPVKKDLYICEDVPEIPQCLFDDMVSTALSLGSKIGVYMRIDMFVANGKYYVQEYTANHMNGLRHCAAKQDDNGCINSCFLGELYASAGAPFGGAPTTVPDLLAGYAAKTPQEQCDVLNSVTPPASVESCAAAVSAGPGP